MSHLTDYEFYPSAEWMWLCIRLNKAGKCACDRLTENADFGQKKKSSFQMKPILILAGMETSKVVAFGAQKTRTHTLKSRRTKLVLRHNWLTFLRKWARRGRYSQWRSLSGHVEYIFVHKNWREGRRYVPHSLTASCFRK